MTAVILPFDRSPLTPADEVLMAAVAAELERLGFRITRATERGYDRYVIRLPWAKNPFWTIGRHHTGRYQTRNGFGAVLRTGRVLEEALLPGWLPTASARLTAPR